MKSNFFFTITVVCSIIVLNSMAHADMLSGGAHYKEAYSISQGGSSKSVYVSPMDVTNKTTGQSMITFCGDYTTSTSSAFGSTTGQAYGSYYMNDSALTIYSAQQKSMITDLFSHTYALAFNTETGEITNKAISQAIQLTIWEILTETQNSYSLTSGSFYSNNLGSLGTLANSFLSVLTGASTWNSLGAQYTDTRSYDLTVYVAEGGVHASQTQISITSSPNTATPEPASMLIFGLGLAGAVPMIRKRMRKNAK